MRGLNEGKQHLSPYHPSPLAKQPQSIIKAHSGAVGDKAVLLFELLLEMFVELQSNGCL